jgi:hypothetical protein
MYKVSGSKSRQCSWARSWVSSCSMAPKAAHSRVQADREEASAALVYNQTLQHKTKPYNKQTERKPDREKREESVCERGVY